MMPDHESSSPPVALPELQIVTRVIATNSVDGYFLTFMQQRPLVDDEGARVGIDTSVTAQVFLPPTLFDRTSHLFIRQALRYAATLGGPEVAAEVAASFHKLVDAALEESASEGTPEQVAEA